MAIAVSVTLLYITSLREIICIFLPKVNCLYLFAVGIKKNDGIFFTLNTAFFQLSVLHSYNMIIKKIYFLFGFLYCLRCWFLCFLRLCIPIIYGEKIIFQKEWY